MSDSYTKLFRGITSSTIVESPLATRWLWVTLLAEADKQGNVWAAVTGLARKANITLAECLAGLAELEGPDPYSRTPDYEGRRITKIDGGWHLLNHGKYDDIRSASERAEYKRDWDRANRPSGAARAKAKQSDAAEPGAAKYDGSPTKSDGPTPPALAPTPSDTSNIIEGVAGSAAPPGAGTQLEGSFEGHTGVMVVAPNPVAPFAIALNTAGFRCTPMNPDLIAYVGEGGRVDNLLACAAQPECAGKPATYVIRFARRELATVAGPVQAGGGSSLSAVDQIEAHIRANRARDEQGPALEGESVRIAR